MLFLDQRPGISNADLARRAFVTPQTMIRIVAGLERDGLLTRHPHRQNGRILQTRLTSAGKDVLTRARPVVDRVQAAMLAPFTAIEQETLYQWLLTIAHTMEQQLEVADTAETERVAVPNAQPPRREEVDGRTNDESDA